MRTNVIIVDDFYTNPDDVRKFALAQEFDQTGNYPGKRTKTFLNQSTMECIESILKPFSGDIIDWCANDGLTGSFQITTSCERSWIHADDFNSWAGICYLTPNAPLSGGTGLFRYKETKNMYQDNRDYTGETQDMTKWELVNQIGNIYNRLVLYRGNLWHTSLDYFGKSNEDGRLFQLFFLVTER